MKLNGKAARLRRELNAVWRSMDFVSTHPALEKEGKEGERYGVIYQQLGALWGYLADECPHRSGWRKARGGNLACKICGTIKGAERVGEKRGNR